MSERAGFVLTLFCIAIITVLCSLHLAEEERAGYFTLFVFLLSSNCKCSVSFPRGAVDGLWSVDVIFPGHTPALCCCRSTMPTARSPSSTWSKDFIQEHTVGSCVIQAFSLVRTRKIIFLFLNQNISMLWVLKRTALLAPKKHMLKIMGKKIFTILR